MRVRAVDARAAKVAGWQLAEFVGIAAISCCLLVVQTESGIQKLFVASMLLGSHEPNTNK